MLWTIFVILFIMWLLGMVSSYTLNSHTLEQDASRPIVHEETSNSAQKNV